MVEWTNEKLAKLSSSQLSSLRENVTRMGRVDIVTLCNDELARRRGRRTKGETRPVSEKKANRYVCEFHFVCSAELGVTRNQDGTIWTGTWVVAGEHAERASQYGAIVALHESKAKDSYLQGSIKGWRKSPREARYSGDSRTQIDEGIDFLFQPSEGALPWKGEGAGEKGYLWAVPSD